jgi:CHAD domain-containing protein
MKARRVKGLDPDGPLADNAARIVVVRLAELRSFVPKALDPAEVDALHDMRIAAKRLRYVLELVHPCFGPYAKTAIKHLKALQDVLGDIHDADVHLPEVAGMLDALVAEGASAAHGDPEALRRAPGHRAYAGLVALQVQIRGRRSALLEDFLSLWEGLERKGFSARLEFALTERSQPVHGDWPRDAMMPPTP